MIAIKILSKKSYGTNAVIVFDGYKRSTKSSSVNLRFEIHMRKFLSNDINKSRLITLLTKTFEDAEYCVKQADEDADRLIVTSALDIACDFQSVIIVGEDTDLLIILTRTAKETHQNVYFLKPSKGKTS